MDASGVESNNLLSQSYSQGLERIAQNKDKFRLFELPKEIIEAREQTWDNLCKKYSEELSDEIEITLNSPSDEEEEDSDEDEEEEDEKEEEDNIDEKYFNKNRTPIRKSKLLVQYWVDTGNPPYGLMNENYKSDTGSSLSEVESPKMGQSHVNNTPKEVTKKVDGSSIYSSVDTAAYILSNTNVTKKAETIAIVEGAKELTPPRATSEANVNLNTSNVKNTPERDANDDHNASSVSSAYASEILTKLEEKIQGKSLHRSRLSLCTSDESGEQELSKNLQTSMKITDVLPALEQLDNLMSNSAVDSLKKLPEEGSRASSGTPSLVLSKKLHRRKLYTGRDSPMDIIVSSSLDSEKLPNATNIHPAFQGTPKVRVRQSVFRRKSIANRRQSKLRSSEDSQDKNSEQAPEGQTTKFFKSLGLVPSPSFNTRTKRKTIRGVVSRKISKKRQGRKLDRRRNGGSDGEHDESGEVSTSQSDLLVLCASKLLSVPLERLSESVLRKVEQRAVAGDAIIAQSAPKAVELTENDQEKETTKEIMKNEKKQKANDRPASRKQIEPSKSRDSSFKRDKTSSPLSKIEVDSQGSDQSTIIICKCKQDVRDSFSSKERSDETSENSRGTLKKEHWIRKSNKGKNAFIGTLRNGTVRTPASEKRKKLKSRNVKAKTVNLENVNNNKEIMIVIDRCSVPESSPIAKKTEKKSTDISTKLTTIGTHLMTDCDSFSDSSVDKKERKLMNETKRRHANPIITFSSDDESDFMKVMNRSAEKYERELRTKSIILSKDQQDLITDLTVQPVELLLNRIVESDEEEIIEFTNKEVKSSKGKNTMSSKNQKSVKKSPQKAVRTSKRLSIVRVLSFDDASSKNSGEMSEESPPKRFKTENGIIKKQNIKKSSDSDMSSLNDSMNLLFGRTRSGGVKRKADSDKPDDEPISFGSNKSVEKAQSPIVKLTRVDKPDTSPIRSPIKKCEVVLESSIKQATSPIKSSQDIKLKELHIKIPKIPEDLEKSFQNSMKKLSTILSPSKSLNSIKKSLSSTTRKTRNSKKRSLPSDDESSEPDFIVKNTSPKKIMSNHDSSDAESTKCTKLFHNSFDDSDSGFKFSFKTKKNNNRSIINQSNSNRTMRMLRTQQNSDSDD